MPLDRQPLHHACPRRNHAASDTACASDTGRGRPTPKFANASFSSEHSRGSLVHTTFQDRQTNGRCFLHSEGTGSEAETQLVAVWRARLQLQPLALHSDLFFEQAGTSQKIRPSRESSSAAIVVLLLPVIALLSSLDSY